MSAISTEGTTDNQNFPTSYRETRLPEMNFEVEYRVSLYPSKFAGYQSKAGDHGEVTVFLASLWDEQGGFEEFIHQFVFVNTLERACLERAFQKIRMRHRCEPTCRMEPVALGLYLRFDGTGWHRFVNPFGRRDAPREIVEVE